MGIDIYWDNVVKMKHKVLVGHWEHIRMSSGQMKEWVQKCWFCIVGNRPKVSMLLNSWFGFHFMTVEDADRIGSISCVKGRGFLCLQNQTVRFNPIKEDPQRKYIWVKLPSLPLELWTKKEIMEIANKIGKFYYVDEGSAGLLEK